MMQLHAQPFLAQLLQVRICSLVLMQTTITAFNCYTYDFAILNHFYSLFVSCMNDKASIAIICYDAIRNLTRFEASQPALKWVNPLQNRLTGFATSSSPWAGFEASQLTVKRFLTRFTTVAGEWCTLRVEASGCNLGC